MKSILDYIYIKMMKTRVGTKYLKQRKNTEKKRYHKSKTDAIIAHLNAIEDIYIPAATTHPNVFMKYKNINKGKTLVLLGTGPTLDYYEPLKEADINIGVNRAFMRADILLDYLFTADREEYIENMIFRYKGNNCKKFYPYIYRGMSKPIPNYFRDNENVESFYVLSHDYGVFGHDLRDERFFIFSPDISVAPLKSYGTTMFSAFQFALWTHPAKIYIVGCDCSTGYSSAINADTKDDYSYLINPWKKAKEFADEYYPDIEITSINPVGLIGVFKDVYTDSYKRE